MNKLFSGILLCIQFFACNNEDVAKDREAINTPSLNDERSLVLSKIDKSFQLSNSKAFNGVVYDLKPNHSIVPNYFSEDIKKYGLIKADQYNWEGTSNCATFDLKNNQFKFRYSGETFDLKFKVISNYDEYYYLTNTSKSKLVKLLPKEKFFNENTKEYNYQTLEFYTYDGKFITSARAIVMESYDECLLWTNDVVEGMRNMSDEANDMLGGERKGK